MTEVIQKLRPTVRKTDGFMVPWDRSEIVEQLMTETKLAEEFDETRSINKEEAEEIAFEVERKVFDLNLKFISGPLIRELVNNVLLAKSRDKPEFALYRNILTRVGAPVYNAYLMDVGQEELREKLQADREAKGCCEYCSAIEQVEWRGAATAYPWDQIKVLEDQNRKLFLCEECADEYYYHWQEMWDWQEMYSNVSCW